MESSLENQSSSLPVSLDSTGGLSSSVGRDLGVSTARAKRRQTKKGKKVTESLQSTASILPDLTVPSSFDQPYPNDQQASSQLYPNDQQASSQLYPNDQQASSQLYPNDQQASSQPYPVSEIMKNDKKKERKKQRSERKKKALDSLNLQTDQVMSEAFKLILPQGNKHMTSSPEILVPMGDPAVQVVQQPLVKEGNRLFSDAVGEEDVDGIPKSSPSQSVRPPPPPATPPQPPVTPPLPSTTTTKPPSTPLLHSATPIHPSLLLNESDTRSCDSHDTRSCDSHDTRSRDSHDTESCDSHDTRSRDGGGQRTVQPNTEDGDLPVLSTKREAILGITIHQCDRLRPDDTIRHPVVKVHFIETSTGDYITKSESSRKVTSYYENINYIMPVATQPSHFNTQRMPFVPVWEETLVLNENVNAFTSPSIVALFEVMDFVDLASKESRVRRSPLVIQNTKGWHKIAWAFLKVCGQDHHNLEKKCKLQLYTYPKPSRSGLGRSTFASDPKKCDVYQIWSSHHREKYPSTLSVTLQGIQLEEELGNFDNKVLRSVLPNQPEEGNTTFEELQQRGNVISPSLLNGQEETDGLGDLKQPDPTLPWTKLPGQSCIIPRRLSMKLQSGSKGSTALVFSKSGRLLAAALVNDGSYSIAIYSIPDGKLRAELIGHSGVIYDLSWSHDDHMITSASSDCTSRCWFLLQNQSTTQIDLPHPCFVYASQVHPKCSDFVITGAFDGVMRGWMISRDESKSKCVFEASSSSSLGYINCLCYGLDDNLLFSGHSKGSIGVWTINFNERDLPIVNLEKVLQFSEFQDKSITMISVHPLGNRILVQSTNSSLALVDLRIEAIQNTYTGVLNASVRMRGCMCACGSYVLSGSEDNTICVWSTATGEPVHVFRNLPFSQSMMTLVYHPHDHVFAAASFGSNKPIILFKDH